MTFGVPARHSTLTTKLMDLEAKPSLDTLKIVNETVCIMLLQLGLIKYRSLKITYWYMAPNV